MARSRRNPNICPKCGTPVEPKKTWQLVSPFPDKKGRITVTVMGSYECPNCGHKWRAVVSKLKVGGSEVEVEAGGRKASVQSKQSEEERERAPIIEIDIDEDEE